MDRPQHVVRLFLSLCSLTHVKRSLIYQLLDYERKLGNTCVSPSLSERSLEEEWGRRRQLLDDEPSDHEDQNERESSIIMQEAKALDKAMEDRVVARKASSSSVGSSGVGMGSAWRSRYGVRKRTGSIASNMTNGSVFSEDLVEEDEEQELLDVGGGFDSSRPGSTECGLTSVANSPESDSPDPVRTKLSTSATARSLSKPPPSAPIWRTTFNYIPPLPASATRSTFDLSARSKSKRRPAALGLLPPVPSSPVHVIIDTADSDDSSAEERPQSSPSVRPRVESRKSVPPPLHLRSSVLIKANQSQKTASIATTPSQTLFVFPPSPTTARTPSTMTLTSTMVNPMLFPSLTTPRVSTFRAHGRTRSFIGLGAPPTPTTAFSKVDARGYVGLE